MPPMSGLVLALAALGTPYEDLQSTTEAGTHAGRAGWDFLWWILMVGLKTPEVPPSWTPALTH